MGTIVSAEVALTVTLESALHIGTGLGMAQLLDDRTVQGPHPRASAADVPYPYIPGASLKGRLRYHARQLSAALGWSTQARSAAEGALFGFDQQAGGLVYADLHLDPEQAGELLGKDGAQLLPLVARGERSFVSLARGRKVARSGRLFRIELAERGLAFEGTFAGFLSAEQLEPEQSLGLLLAALRDLSHLGGHKGRGLGKCGVTIGAVTLDGKPRAWDKLVEALPCTS
jgi:CRISPR/Cas system CSM-associated protein Csm3 (group 7 of RAMP superfamily)